VFSKLLRRDIMQSKKPLKILAVPIDVGLAHATRLAHMVRLLYDDPRNKNMEFTFISGDATDGILKEYLGTRKIFSTKLRTHKLMENVLELSDSLDLGLAYKLMTGPEAVLYVKKLYELLKKEKPDIILCDTNFHFMYALRMYLHDEKENGSSYDPIVISSLNGYMIFDKIDHDNLPIQMPENFITEKINDFLRATKSSHFITSSLLSVLNFGSYICVMGLSNKLKRDDIKKMSLFDLLQTNDMKNGYHFILDFPNVTVPLKNKFNKNDIIIGPPLIKLAAVAKDKTAHTHKNHIFITMGGTTDKETLVATIRFALRYFEEKIVVTTGNIVGVEELQKIINDPRLDIHRFVELSSYIDGAQYVIHHGGAGTFLALLDYYHTSKKYPRSIIIASNIDQLTRGAYLQSQGLAYIVRRSYVMKNSAKIDEALKKNIEAFKPTMKNVPDISFDEVDLKIKNEFFSLLTD